MTTLQKTGGPTMKMLADNVTKDCFFGRWKIKLVNYPPPNKFERGTLLLISHVWRVHIGGSQHFDMSPHPGTQVHCWKKKNYQNDSYATPEYI